MPGLFFPESEPTFFHPLPAVGVIVLGRSPRCDVFLPDIRVSRAHAMIEITDAEHLLCDQSQNGTRVNQRSIKQHVLQPHDQIQIGRFCMEFHSHRPKSDFDPIRHTVVEKNPVVVGHSRIFLDVLRQGRLAATSDYPILISGETGTGKEVIAHDLIAHSPRADKPIVTVNCAALSPSLAESELFGHERGAFTGAIARRTGVFEAAGDGTLFLDEIGELPLELQPKLLRVLEEGKFKRLGSPQDQLVHARMLFATNRKLSEEVRAGRFREDLFHRISMFNLHLPPLRLRKTDLAVLAEHLLTQAGFIQSLTPAALSKLRAYDWPGNVRELRNFLIRTAVLNNKKVLHETDLILPLPTEIPNGGSPQGLTRKALRQSECEVIHKHLNQYHWNRVQTAKALGISRSTLFLKMRKYGFTTKSG